MQDNHTHLESLQIRSRSFGSGLAPLGLRQRRATQREKNDGELFDHLEIVYSSESERMRSRCVS